MAVLNVIDDEHSRPSSRLQPFLKGLHQKILKLWTPAMNVCNLFLVLDES